MAEKRVFSEQEAAEIMQRAVRLQESSSQGEQYTPGITVEELKKIALEAGIDLQFVDKAIAGIDVKETSKTGPFNLTEDFERVIEGEIDPDDFDKVLSLFPHTQRQNIKQVGRTLSGSAPYGAHLMGLSVESRKGRTRVNVKYVPVFAYLIGMHGPLIGAIVALASQIAAGRAWLGFGIAAGLLAVGSFAFRALVKAGRKAAKLLTDKIVQVVEDEAGPLRENLKASPTASVEDEIAKQELGN